MPLLARVLSRPIDWELIARQYDQLVRYATALRLGTAEAEQVLRRFTRGGPKHPTYAALEELGRYDEAFIAYQRAVERAPGLATYTRAAYALDLQGDITGAARSLELALGEAFTPGDIAFANFSLGELAWNRGDRERARQHYERAAGADPDALGPKAGLARVAAATGAMDGAISRWRDVVERGPLPEYVGELVNLYQVTGRAADAEQQTNLLAAQRVLLAANGVNARRWPVSAEVPAHEGPSIADRPGHRRRARHSAAGDPRVGSPAG